MPKRTTRYANSSHLLLHPFLLGMYPVLALLTFNYVEIEPNTVVRSLFVAMLLAVVVLLFARLFTKHWLRAGLLASFWLVLFFSYGHVYNLLAPTPLGRHRVLFPIWMGILGVGSFWILGRVTNLKRSTAALNIISSVLLLMALTQIITGQIQKSAQPETLTLPAELLHARLPADPPDIYYIILDGYARQDALSEDIQLDNSAFIAEMEALGFYAARCSQSNYAQTKLSLSSALNMNYLEEYYHTSDPQRTESHGLEPFVTNSLVRRVLERLGYVTVAFETGYDWTEIQDADIYFAQKPNLEGGINAFEALLIRSTVALVLSDAAVNLPDILVPDLSNPDLLHRGRVLFTLDQLPDLPATDRPKFVFAHVVSPHPPYVFDFQGDLPDLGNNDVSLYRDQILYLNSRVIPIIAEIIAETDTPPVIIVQGDHGAPISSDTARMQILNLYLVPKTAQTKLYPTITPINTFRVIFNSLFGTNLPLLEDQSFFSRYQNPFNFEPIPNEDPDCLPS